MGANDSDYILGVKKPSNNNSNKPVNTRTIFTAIVISNDDPTNGCRIKCKIPVYDSNLSDESDKIFANPILPITNNTLPKVGESVLVILSDISKPYSLRYYIGPIIPQYQNMGSSPAETALCLTNEATTAPLASLDTIADAEGIYPISSKDKEGVNIIGRSNTDITQNTNEVLIRSGKHLTKSPLIRNKRNIAYSRYRLTEDNETSSISHVADYHFLLSHKSKNSFPERILTDKDIEFLKDNSSSLLKAEPTIELLKLIVNYLCVGHSHEYNNLSSSEDDTNKSLLNFDFNSLSSDYHRIN